jgi:hypothetical protein
LLGVADVVEGSAHASRGGDPAVYFTQLRNYFAALPADRFPNLVEMADELLIDGLAALA